MATSGSNDIKISNLSSSTYNEHLVLSWTRNSVNVASNTSNITVSLKAYSTYGSSAKPYNLVGNTVRLTVGSSVKSENTNASIDFRNTSASSMVTLATWTGDVTHNNSGELSLSLTGFINYADTETSHSGLPGDHTVTVTAVLDTIPRASSPTATNCNFGGSTTITTNRASSSFTHTITVSMGSHSQTITSVGASTKFTVPSSWADTIPTAESATLNISCKTYNGTTQVGTAKTTSATVSVPSSWKPSVTVSKTITRPDGSGNGIKGVSTVTVTASAVASTGTTISSYSWQGTDLSTTSSASATTSILSTVGTGSWTVTVTDRRGRHATTTITATIVDGASTFTCDSAVEFDQNHTVTITRKNSYITHSVERKIGTLYTNTQTSVATSNTYKIPTAWAVSASSADTASMTVTVKSYYNNTLIGSNASTVIVNVPSSWLPSIGNPTATKVDYYPTSATTESSKKLLKLHSKVTISVASGTASSGAMIVSYKFSGNALNETVTSSSSSASATSSVFTEAGSHTYTVTITDSRGRTASKTITGITVLDYTKPTLSLTAHRCDSNAVADDNGDYCEATSVGTYDSSISGNAVTLAFKYKKSGGSYTSLADSSNATRTDLFAADIDYAYVLVATITDSVGSSAKASMTLSTAKTLMGYYKDKMLTLGKPPTSNLYASLGGSGTKMFSGMAKNYLDGETYIPASGTDGLTNGWQKVDVGIWNRFYTTTISSSSSKTFQLDKLYKGLLVLNGARTQQRGLYLISNSSSLSATVVTVFAASDFSVTGSTNGTLTIANNYSSAAGYIMFISSYGTVS